MASTTDSRIADSTEARATSPGLDFDRTWTKEGVHPYDEVTWERRTAAIASESGKNVFEQTDVEVPGFWSQMATNVVVSKYFRGHIGEASRETSVRQMIDRVARTIANMGSLSGYFADIESATVFEHELTYLLLHQMMAFNSPVWFNVGWRDRPQVSACFINSVDDSLDSIMDLAKTEVMLFKYGSGAGVNLSSLRADGERLSGGGTASGPLSFMRGWDQFAGATKSGGSTRRAAKMIILDADHPDVEKFIDSKAHEEQKAWALIEAGYDPSFTGEAYGSVMYQNANHSVRVTDEFMRAVETDGDWVLEPRVDKAQRRTVKARALWHQIAAAAHLCGDPGVQYDTTIQEWHTSPASGRINASNPCCLTGDTMVDTAEGRIRFDALEEMDRQGIDLPMVFAFDRDDGLPVLRHINKVWVAGTTRHIVEITTAKGISVRATPEHRFLLHDGRYVEASGLRTGDRLRKIGRFVNTRRQDRHYINHRGTDQTPNGTVNQARFMWEQAYGPIPAGSDVHHTNHDATDDRLSNFELIVEGRHEQHHSRGEANARYLAPSDELLVETWEGVEREPRLRNSRGPQVTVARWNSYIRRYGLQGIVPIARFRDGEGLIRGMSWADFESFISERRSLVNDRVLRVEVLELATPETVYDMEVEGVHNFAVTSGDVTHSVVLSNSEYLYLDNTACNLASLNLMKFVQADGEFNTDDFARAVQVTIIAQEILVGNASYPTPAIEANSHKYRTLGIGYANLGALLMSRGLAYDSDEGRAYAAAITSLMSGTAYAMSALISSFCGGPFTEYDINRDAMLRVIGKHRSASASLPQQHDAVGKIAAMAGQAWIEAEVVGKRAGFRNAQISVLAPTGTISFLMDCDTTGVEPDIALVKYKKLVGEGYLKIVNQTVPPALSKLGYSPEQVEDIVHFIDERETIEGAPWLKPEHLSVFDCAFKPVNGERSIHHMGHIKMMAAVQPFISGAISKTVNMPETATVEEIEQVYMEGWKLGLKAIAIYRDGSKRSQPLSTGKKKDSEVEALKARITELETIPVKTSPRRRLPAERAAVTHKFDISGHEGYITVGLYDDGVPGEIFITMAKEGSTVGGLMDSLATAISICLQYQVPLKDLVSKFSHVRFEPAGFTGNQEIPIAKSIVDYIFRWLGIRFLTPASADALGLVSKQVAAGSTPIAAPVLATAGWATVTTQPTTSNGNGHAASSPLVAFQQGDAPVCAVCGEVVVRSGSCYVCMSCGTTTGCS